MAPQKHPNPWVNRFSRTREFSKLGLGLAGILLFHGCKPVERVVPIPSSAQPGKPSEAPNPAPTSPSSASIELPSPSASAREAATVVADSPPSRPAPKGTYYVLKAFSVTTETGIVGFGAGKPVTLVREEGDNFVVTDGTAQASALRGSFTNDPNAVKDLTRQTVATQQTATDSKAKFERVKRQLAAKNGELLRQQNEALKARKLQQLQADIAALDKRISAAQREIAEKKGSQRPIRRTYDAWGNLISYQGRSMYTLTPDASGVDRLIAQQENLQKQLSALK